MAKENISKLENMAIYTNIKLKMKKKKTENY